MSDWFLSFFWLSVDCGLLCGSPRCWEDRCLDVNNVNRKYACDIKN